MRALRAKRKDFMNGEKTILKNSKKFVRIIEKKTTIAKSRTLINAKDTHQIYTINFKQISETGFVISLKVVINKVMRSMKDYSVALGKHFANG